MTISAGSAASATEVAGVMTATMRDLIQNEIASNVVIDKNYASLDLATGTGNSAGNWNQPGVIITGTEYRTFGGTQYDAFNSSVDTTKWQGSGTMTETTTQINRTETGSTDCYIRAHTTTGLDLKQADGFAEIAFGGSITTDASGTNTHNHQIYLTDGSTEVAVASYSDSFLGTKAEDFFCYIKITRATQIADCYVYSSTGLLAGSTGVSVAALTKYCFKVRGQSTNGAVVAITNVVYAKASNVSALSFTTTDIATTATLANAIVYFAKEDNLTQTFQFTSDAGSHYETLSQTAVNEFGSYSAGAQIRVTTAVTDSDYLIKLGGIGIKYNLY